MKLVHFAALFALFSVPPAQAQSVDGEWDASYETPGGTRSFKLILVTKGDSVTGTVKRTAGDSPLRGVIRGDTIRFSYTIEYGGNALQIDIVAKVTGDTMSGTASFGGQASEAFGARRVKPPEEGDSGAPRVPQPWHRPAEKELEGLLVPIHAVIVHQVDQPGVG